MQQLYVQHEEKPDQPFLFADFIPYIPFLYVHTIIQLQIMNTLSSPLLLSLNPTTFSRKEVNPIPNTPPNNPYPFSATDASSQAEHTLSLSQNYLPQSYLHIASFLLYSLPKIYRSKGNVWP